MTLNSFRINYRFVTYSGKISAPTEAGNFSTLSRVLLPEMLFFNFYPSMQHFEWKSMESFSEGSFF